MKSIRELYKVGKGPSSSHAIGPERAANRFASEHPDADAFQVVLYGSLSRTGIGHGTDRVLRQSFAPKAADIVFGGDPPAGCHPNTMDFTAWKCGKKIASMRVESIGGGDIRIAGEPEANGSDCYPESTCAEVMAFCKRNGITRLSDYVAHYEGEEIWDFLAQIWETMKQSIADGLSASGVLPGGLHIQRKAKYLLAQARPAESPPLRECRILSAYAYAVAEQNADNGTIVTAPTCGACGVLPAVMKYFQDTRGASDREILRGLATAGLFGTLTKQNASISGAECGCQAEIGTACSMAAAALSELYGLNLDQVEYAAEIAMEHHLGLTCDPVRGLVQIPCIERNAVAAMRAMNACNLSYFLYGSRTVSYDTVCRAMYETGLNLCESYKETSEGGLAAVYKMHERGS